MNEKCASDQAAMDTAESVEDSASLILPSMTPAFATRLRGLTPARIGLRRTGISVETGELLDFQLAHARARDAVHALLDPAALLAGLHQLCNAGILQLHSAAAHRTTYLQRPDLGRRLDEPSRLRLTEQSRESMDASFDLAIVIADGLSALATERHALPLIQELFAVLKTSGNFPKVAPFCLVTQGRVAVGDEIAHTLKADLVIMLIGERPGLSSPDSLGAYITWKPQPGKTTDAERNCISNIRNEGLSYSEAAARLMYYVREASSRKMTGVALKDPEGTAQTGLLSAPSRQEERTGATP